MFQWPLRIGPFKAPLYGPPRALTLALRRAALLIGLGPNRLQLCRKCRLVLQASLRITKT